MSRQPAHPLPHQPAAWPRKLARTASFAALWLLLLPSLKLGDLATGAIAVAAASWASLQLRPPETGGLRLWVVLRLAPHFIYESVRAGADVAARALGARVRVSPGYVECPLGFPPGLSRNRFSSFTSLLPGTVPCGDRNGVLVYHCLDVNEPVVEQLWAEEKRLALALVAGRSYG
jgi:multicomponent Na+:H+ antiporter subunit E